MKLKEYLVTLDDETKVCIGSGTGWMVIDTVEYVFNSKILPKYDAERVPYLLNFANERQIEINDAEISIPIVAKSIEEHKEKIAELKEKKKGLSKDKDSVEYKKLCEKIQEEERLNQTRISKLKSLEKKLKDNPGKVKLYREMAENYIPFYDREILEIYEGKSVNKGYLCIKVDGIEQADYWDVEEWEKRSK